MLAGFIVCFCLAAAMAAPTTTAPPSDELSRNSVTPSPEMVAQLNAMTAALQSRAASMDGPTASETALGVEQAANLNVLGGLNKLILNVLKGVLESLRPGTPSPPSTDIFGNPSVPATQPARPPASNRPGIFNPLKFLFPSGGSGPFSMFYPSMMFDLMEGFGELFI